MQNDGLFKEGVQFAKANRTIAEQEREVIGRFSPLFSLPQVVNLDPQDYLAFLRLSNNHHWSGLQRTGAAAAADPEGLRKALALLVDESLPIEDRIDKVTGWSGTQMAKGIGPAILSAILLVTYPERYGVYNSKSIDGLTKVGLNPIRGYNSKSPGWRYNRVNEVLTSLAKEYDVDLWTLDSVWSYVLNPSDVAVGEVNSIPSEPMPSGGIALGASGGSTHVGADSVFSLESFLEEFLVVNWERTPLSGSMEILQADTGETIGQQFAAPPVGRIDLLCKNKGKSGYTVVELKKDRSPDAVVGQVQRYMTWVKRELAKGEPVSGIIICGHVDDKLRYAVEAAMNVSLYTYEVSFGLKADRGLPPAKTEG
jgi:Endonuclease NucS